MFAHNGHPKPGQFFHIFFVAVRSDCQRSGILKGLVSAAESLAKGKGYSSIVVEAASPPTLNYFPKIGYTTIVEAKFRDWQCTLHKEACEGFLWAVSPNHDGIALFVKETKNISST